MSVRSMRGKHIDMARLVIENGHKIAVGSGNMNARGDKVDRSGSIVATREQIMTEYNTSNPRAVRRMGLNDIQQEIMQPSEVAAQLRRPKDTPIKRKIADTE